MYLHTWEAASENTKRNLSSIRDYVLLQRGAKQTTWHDLKDIANIAYLLEKAITTDLSDHLLKDGV